MGLQKIHISNVEKTTKKEITEKAFKLGLEYERTRYGCSQCVVAALV